jgi:hypothetical protein
MASLSTSAVKALMIALASETLGNEVATAIESGASHSDSGVADIAGFIIATNVSTTIDFATLKVADRVIKIPAVAGNAIFLTVVTAGTLPAAAVVGDMYVVIRGLALPAKRKEKF